MKQSVELFQKIELIVSQKKELRHAAQSGAQFGYQKKFFVNNILRSQIWKIIFNPKKNQLYQQNQRDYLN